MNSTVDKNQAMIDYLLGCESIVNSPLYFNFTQAESDNKQFVTTANEKTLNTPYIDGSESKRFTFTIIDYRSVAYNELIKVITTSNPPHVNPDENMQEFLDVQGVIDWIDQQNDLRNFPNFGTDCLIDSITTTSMSPNLNGVDASAKPALAKYSISIQVDYIDNSKCLWK